MDGPVVVGADQDDVFKVGRSAFSPSLSGVMPDAPGRWPVAAWEGAATVPSFGGAALCPVEQSLFTPAVQWE